MVNTRMSRKLPEILNNGERDLLLKQPNPKAPTGFRNYLIMALMLKTGLRLSEVINLRLKDIDFKNGDLYVRQGKGSRDRKLYIRPEITSAIEKWLSWRKVKSPYVFTPLSTNTKLKPRYIQKFVKRYSTRAGINKNIHPHTLRHTFASDLYRETKNLVLVQKALGHADISTTTIYTHLVPYELDNALRNFQKDENIGSLDSALL
jgi:site-specific recombinase XerD